MTTTIASRRIRSSPHLDTVATWEKIVDLLTKGNAGTARDELLSVVGVASSIIADQSPKDAAIVVQCNGPRTRIYCLYDEAAIDGSDAKEETLGYDPLEGDWSVSLPCTADDLPWVERALKAKSSRITARDMSSTLGEGASAAVLKAQDFSLDVEAFLKS
jgi:hypothetical protein